MIPAGINSGIEAFVDGDKVMILKDGKVIPLNDSIQALHDFYYCMSSDSEIEATLERMGYHGTEAVNKFVACRFGEFDSRADLTEDGVSMPEFWNCPERGKCIGEGIVCVLPRGINGKLTPREIQVIKMIHSEMTDTQIGDALQIAENTVHKHRQNIAYKIGCKSVVGIIKFAIENHITA